MNKNQAKKKSERASRLRAEKHEASLLRAKQDKEDRRRYFLNKLTSPKTQPEMNDPEAKRERLLSKLHRNMEVLKQLEAEIEEEDRRKEEVNRELESMGYETLEDKMAALQPNARIEGVDRKITKKVGGAADVVFVPNPPKEPDPPKDPD